MDEYGFLTIEDKKIEDDELDHDNNLYLLNEINLKNQETN
jgi:hypothetical protein